MKNTKDAIMCLAHAYAHLCPKPDDMENLRDLIIRTKELGDSDLEICRAIAYRLEQNIRTGMWPKWR